MYNKMNEYNGYSNKPTWLVNLWMTNEYGSYQFIMESAIQIIEDEGDKDEAVYRIAEFLESIHEDELSEALTSSYSSSLFSDLLNFALAYVNWREIAQMTYESAMEEIENNK